VREKGKRQPKKCSFLKPCNTALKVINCFKKNVRVHQNEKLNLIVSIKS